MALANKSDEYILCGGQLGPVDGASGCTLGRSMVVVFARSLSSSLGNGRGDVIIEPVVRWLCGE